jgi:TetR/AcrR family transcriptional regulator, regulator of cefoperazone and chloramphenicol sensitivity
MRRATATTKTQQVPNGTTPLATREKLLEAAGEVFAERGYYNATIREICRKAGANVAAVNYTFGDKLGLYTEVLRLSKRAPEMARLTEVMDAAGSPQELLRNLIRVRLVSLCGGKGPNWGFRIMMHEFSQPTPAMTRVIDEEMRPVYKRVLKAVGEIIGRPPEHEKTRLCNNSIIGQVLFYTFSLPVLSRLQPELKLTPEQLGRIAEHVADFSLTALKGMAQSKEEPKKGSGHLKLAMRNGERLRAEGARNGHRVRSRSGRN